MKTVIALILSIVAIQSVAQDNATVFIARKGLYSGVKKNIAIYMDDKQIGEISNGKYFAVTVPAGQHKFFGQWYSGDARAQDEAITIDVQAGKEYYLRANKEARGLKEIVVLDEIGASTWTKLKSDLKEDKPD